EFELWEKVTRTTGMVLLRPVGYHEMLRLNMGSRLLLTDSGGLQGESSVLGTPCIVLRWNTEWTVTLAEQGGTCQLAGNDVNRIRQAYEKAIQTPRKPSVPDYWDGRTAERCLEAILKASI
ncbi:MAG: UDP-N-acetylglucosamine 2-epimerase (non-hydrolyzing), partial [Bacteroidetes bacterium]